MPLLEPPPLALRGVEARYGAGPAALAGVDLTVRRGEIFGVIGESGAGKSTLLNLLTGDLAPTRGDVRVLGHEPAALRPRELRDLRRRIGVVFQGVHLLGNRTVRQNVSLPLRLSRSGKDGDRSASDAERVAEMLRFVGLADRAAAFPAELSGGQRQRVGIARALIARPEVLLCDEPTSSLDATTTAGVLGLLRDARRDFGTTVVVVTHDLAVVRAVCDRVALFEHGVLREVLEVAQRADDTGGSYLDRARRELGR